MLTALVALLQTIGCGTITNMMLSRTLARGHELSLRRAIGAGRWRLLRQLLTEGLLLTTTGAAIGVLLGIWGSQVLVQLLSTPDNVITVDSMPTAWTLAAAAGLALVMALAITACSAMCALRANAGDAMRAAPRTGGASAAERRLGALLVSVQVALSLTLVVRASVFALNLHRLLSEPIGLDRARMVVVQADALFAGHTEEKLPRYYDSALERLAALPGIVSASYSRKAPVSKNDGSWWEDVGVDDRPADASGKRTYLNAVSDAYFTTTDVPVLAGRAGPPASAIGAVREALRREDPRVPVRLETLEARIAESLVQERALALLATSLGGTALLLAAAALYGLMAYSATARTREFGVRVALGATPSAIGRLVLRDAVRITVIGIVAGMALAVALGRFAATLLVAITPTDPAALTGATVLVIVVTVCAALAPARRSARTSPSEALRAE